ncbi:hypothetical protein [Nannocystis sp.]|uniref:hypothetical protein n=1 Tax=Nannocystis sp. TaxID=1962667 RepID=UPI00242548C7|nr:hypothetical protein [Nannocystis sp.]MBK7827253.1 hypothetical protein [Nannocystis sp.]MBK9754664.1 hypothetical protein [Nannocystis sp.]
MLRRHALLLASVLLAPACVRRADEARPPDGSHARRDPHPHDGLEHEHVESDGELNISPAGKPCPGPEGLVRVRVLDTTALEESDPLAFVREPELRFVVMLAVVETLVGEAIGSRLGVLVHSPTLFAGKVWGRDGSPEKNPAMLELRWSHKYCMFEVMQFQAPPSAHADAANEAPRVHSTVLGQ